jgi:hypothetical protein
MAADASGRTVGRASGRWSEIPGVGKGLKKMEML